MNVFTAVAWIGKDPEQRYSANGDSIVSFNGAVDSGFGDKESDNMDQICTRYGAKEANQSYPTLLKVIRSLFLENLLTGNGRTKEGQDRYSLEVRVNEILPNWREVRQSTAPT